MTLLQIGWRRRGAVALLLGLTALRLSSDLGMRPAVATEVYLVTVTGIVVGWCFLVLTALPASDPSGRLRDRRPTLRSRPERLEILEESTEYWVASAYNVHHRLRPECRALLRLRLARAGADLDTDHRVPLLLGPATWALVRPDAPPPPREDAPGLSPAEIDEITRTLAALSADDSVGSGLAGGTH